MVRFQTGFGVTYSAGFLQRPDGLLAPPAAVCETETSGAGRRAYGSGAPLLNGFGEFAMLDGPRLTQLRDLGVRVSVQVHGLGFGISYRKTSEI